MVTKKIKALSPKKLRKTCDPEQFSFATTEDLADLTEFVGQNRAVKATTFGISIQQEGFNIFALGPPGVGKRSIIRSLLTHEAKKRPAAPDICYIYNFKNPREPIALLLPPEQGNLLAKDMRQLVEVLKTSIPAILESDAYIQNIKQIQEQTRKKQEDAFSLLEQQAEADQVAILRTPEGLVLATKKDGKMLSEEEFKELPPEEKEVREKSMRSLHEKLMEYLEQIPVLNNELRKQMKEAFRALTTIQVGSAIEQIKEKYQQLAEVVHYLNEVQQAIIDNPSDFRKKADKLPTLALDQDEAQFNRYTVNILVDNSGKNGAPIIYEDNPNFSNLVGRIDHISQFGALHTDFSLMRAGALHKANGGFLLLDAQKLLSQPFAWDGLKRVLKAKEIRIENINQVLGYMATVSLEPKAIALDQKVILLGDRLSYYQLCTYDPEFLELFKVAADFDDELCQSPKNNLLFAQLLKSLAQKDHLKPLSKAAVAAVIEYASRIVEDQEKISTHARRLADLLREADHYASQERRLLIEPEDIEQAISQAIYRASRAKERQQEFIDRGTILIDTEGLAIGQVNALSYVPIGGFAFGFPVRITASVGAGKGELIDIEREAKLGGPIHSKGVLILTGYLKGHYLREEALSLFASLVFEQSYGSVEGDSASLAEACALLSAIAQIPLKQSIAMTGSMNQHGQVQAIGGVNEKIEGFFDICQKRGLSGEQGVIIPKTNVDGLMLKKEIVAQAEAGQFHIYAVETIDEALAILSDMNAGKRDENGSFPVNSINHKIESSLKALANKSKSDQSLS